MGIVIAIIKRDTDSNQERVSINDNSSRVEAVKQQIQKNIPAITNKPSPIDSPERHSNPALSDEKPILSTTKRPIQTPEQHIINVIFDPSETKVQSASEVVDVPKGVTVKVRRVRIVEHSVNIEWSSAITSKGEIGIKQLVSASIQGEIQKVKGYILQQTESMEYEITLDGEKHSQYQLVWMDVWLKGIAEINEGINSYQQPFQFRDRAELKVVPLLT